MLYKILSKFIEVNLQTGEISPKEGTYINSYINSGYRVFRLNGTTYPFHKVIVAFNIKKYPKDLVDHIDGNKLNNSISNLRECTYVENNCNRRMRSDNTLGYKGIFKRQLKDRVVYGWMIKLYGLNESKSGFSTPEEAFEDRKKALILAHGDFANFG